MIHRLQNTIFPGSWTLDIACPRTGEFEHITEIQELGNSVFECREHGLKSVPGESLDSFAVNILKLVNPYARKKPGDYSLELFGIEPER
jgi:hypothetical protein